MTRAAPFPGLSYDNIRSVFLFGEIMTAKTQLPVILLLMGCAWLLSACDPDHRRKCEWYLVPDPTRIDLVDEGYVPVCARNYVVNKQDCRLQSKLDFAKKAHLKKFRLADLRVRDYGLPRTIKQIRFCK